jgi:hypothetical protein
MSDFFETATVAYKELNDFSPQALRNLIQMRGRIRKVLRALAG